PMCSSREERAPAPGHGIEAYDLAWAGLRVLAGRPSDGYVRGMATGTALTALESAFLDVERPGLPMHVAALTFFEPMPGRPVTMRDLQLLLASRLPRLPGFRKRPYGGLLGLGRRWMEGDDIDVEAHQFQHHLPP